jgi:hypothetical protein
MQRVKKYVFGRPITRVSHRVYAPMDQFNLFFQHMMPSVRYLAMLAVEYDFTKWKLYRRT